MKKRFLFIPLLASLCLAGCGNDWENDTGEYSEHDIGYLYKNVKYGDAGERNYIDIALPKNPAEKTGLVLWIHGGGWVKGNKSISLMSQAYMNALISKGYAVASMNYRYASKSDGVNYNSILDDVTKALAKTKKIGQLKNIDLTKTFISGHSAGAHITMLYSYSRRAEAPITPVGCMPFAGPTNFMNETYYTFGNKEYLTSCITELINHKVDVSNYKNYEADLKAASPLTYLTDASKAVPTIICHGKKDDVVPFAESEALYNRLKELNVQVTGLTFANSDHSLNKDPDMLKKSGEVMLEYITQLF